MALSTSTTIYLDPTKTPKLPESNKTESYMLDNEGTIGLDHVSLADARRSSLVKK